MSITILSSYIKTHHLLKTEKMFLVFVLLFIVNTTHAERGKLISYKLVKSYTENSLDSLWKDKNIKKFVAPINNGLDIFEVIYETAWHDGSLIKASGIFFLPRKAGQADKPFPMICYHHGTQMVKEREIDFTGEQVICTVFSASGYMIAYPDYVGLGAGEKTHLYHHAETEASSAIDLLRAVKKILIKENAKQNKYLFLTGYSQGGHATLATLKTIQEKHTNEFTVTATAAMSGAYDLAGKQSQVMFKPYKHPSYLPYLMYSYQEAHKCFDDPKNCFKPGYAEAIKPLLDGQHTMIDIDNVMLPVPKDVLKDEFVSDLINNDNAPFKVALRENSVHDFKPEVPLMMCYCKADEQVNYKHAFVARDAMKAKGAKNIRLQNAGNNFQHAICAIYSSAYTKMYFDSFVKGSKKGRKGPLIKRLALATLKVKG